MTPERLPLPVLQGERCLLRALVPSDAGSLRRHADNVAVWRNLFEGFPSPYLAEHAEAWCGHEANSGAFGYVWGIEFEGEVVGCCGVVPQDDKPGARCNAETGYWLGESAWHRGIASDALRQVVDWTFVALPQLTRIFAAIYVRNTASQAVARRCGFVQEGVMRQSVVKAGEVIDAALWATYRPQVEPRPADIAAALALTAVAANAMERP